MKVIKLTEETLIALIRGQKLEMKEGEEITTIIPPMYDDTDKFHSAFTLGTIYKTTLIGSFSNILIF